MLKRVAKYITNIHVEKNIIIYLFCVLIATLLWFLNTLNKTFTTEISYPVKFTNIPNNKKIISEVPKTLQLEIRGKGFAIISHKLNTSFMPISINVASISNNKIESDNITEYTIITDNIKERINSQLHSDLSIIDVNPDEITLSFSKNSKRKVPVKSNINYVMKRQYILKDKIKISPDSVEVIGPSTYLDTLNSIYTQQIKIDELSGQYSKQVKLMRYNDLIINQENVTVNIDTEKFTETKRSIKLSTINVPDSLTLKLFPESITITFDVGISRYESIKENNFTLAVDYSEIGAPTLQVKVIESPSFVNNITISPKQIEYIIEKKIRH